MSDEWKAPVGETKEDRNSWKLLEKTLLAGVQEQRRARRWGIFFKLLTFVYLFGALALFSPALQFGKEFFVAIYHTTPQLTFLHLFFFSFLLAGKCCMTGKKKKKKKKKKKNLKKEKKKKEKKGIKGKKNVT